MTFLRGIEEIPNYLEEINNNFEKRLKGLREYLVKKDIKNLVFVASGSSYNSAKITRSLTQKIDIHTEYLYPNDFVNYTKNFNKKSLYIFISQSGKTKLVLKAVQKAKQLGLFHCSITSSEDSPLAQESDIFVDMGCGNEEFLFRTIGVSTSILTCCQIALCISKKCNYDYYKEDIELAIKNLEFINIATKNWYSENKFKIL
ncbi:MAG: SIS domain-containing protein, partial [Erysipelotrichaceae bacterium]